MDPQRVEAYLRSICSVLDFDIGELWCARKVPGKDKLDFGKTPRKYLGNIFVRTKPDSYFHSIIYERIIYRFSLDSHST